LSKNRFDKKIISRELFMSEAPLHGSLTPATVNVSRIINSERMSGLQARVIALCGLVILFDGFDAIAIGLAGQQIASSLQFPLSSLGLVFGIGQAGLLVGAIFLGTLADQFGRKWLAVIAVVAFGVWTFATAFASSYEQLLLFRFLAGLGLGGTTPNIVALTSEYAPKRMRAGLVALVWTAYPLGGVLVGFASAVLLPRYGWESIFYIGGVLPLLIAVVLAALLPESMTFLVTRQWRLETVAAIVRRIRPDLPVTRDATFETDDIRLPGPPVQHLFLDGRAAVTILLWVAFFAAFFVLVFIVSWIPSLLRLSGLSMSQAGLAIGLHSIGSVIGSCVVGFLMDRFGRYPILLTAYALAAIATYAVGYAATSFDTVAVVIMLSGCFAAASQTGIIALAAVINPVAIRSTALGWAMASGRLGAVVAPLLGGYFVGWAWPIREIFAVIAAVALAGGVAVFGLRALAAPREDGVASPSA
jgi:AAHS family 4-hydroxybenzoate transporter-like MFS transporter